MRSAAPSRVIGSTHTDIRLGPGVRIAAAARYVGCSAATLRLWERQRLIRPLRTPSGYRLYGVRDLSRLRRIAQLRRVERLNAAGIRRVLAIEDAERSPARTGTRIGARLKRIRRIRGLTLAQAASSTGLSISFLSSLEREETGISVATLRKLVTHYRTTLGELLTGATSLGLTSITRANRRARTVGRFRGVRIEHLVRAPVLMEAQLFEVMAGAGSGEAYTHDGEEFIYVLSGTLEVRIEGHGRYVVKEGDCLYFASSFSHSWRNTGKAAARLLWVNTPPTF